MREQHFLSMQDARLCNQYPRLRNLKHVSLNRLLAAVESEFGFIRTDRFCLSLYLKWCYYPQLYVYMTSECTTITTKIRNSIGNLGICIVFMKSTYPFVSPYLLTMKMNESLFSDYRIISKEKRNGCSHSPASCRTCPTLTALSINVLYGDYLRIQIFAGYVS